MVNKDEYINCVADVFRHKLKFIWKNSKIAFCATLWGVRGNVHDSSVARWKSCRRFLSVL